MTLTWGWRNSFEIPSGHVRELLVLDSSGITIIGLDGDNYEDETWAEIRDNNDIIKWSYIPEP